MKKQVVLICGSMQSGKTSAANFLTGFKMKAGGATSEFEIDEGGMLAINASFRDENEELKEGVCSIDLSKLHYTDDIDFIRYANNLIWPHARICSVADSLKQTVSMLFGVPIEKLYGSNEDKQIETCVEWNDVLKFYKGAAIAKLKKLGKQDRKVTARELCQEFSDVCRTFNIDCFVRPCLDEILNSPFGFYIVPDGRFTNEIEFFDKAEEDGLIELKKIYLQRRINDDSHEGENLDKHYNMELFDAVISNQNMSIKEKNDIIYDYLVKWGWAVPTI